MVGCGPGPFTGLRVGMATAAAYGHALGVPVHGVCSLDAIGNARPAVRSWWSPTPAAARSTGRATATDVRIDGPGVDAAADVAGGAARAVAGPPDLRRCSNCRASSQS